MTRTAPLSRAASCLVLPKSAIWSRLVSLRLSLECKRLEAPPPGLLMLHHAPLLHFLNEAEEDAVASGSLMREAELPQTASFTFHAGCAPSMRSRQRVLFSQTRNRLRVTSNSPSRALSVSQLSPGSSRWPKHKKGRLSEPERFHAANHTGAFPDREAA